MKTFNLQVITPEALVYECSSAVRIDLPTKAGEIGVLAGHTPMMSLLRAGEVRIQCEGDDATLSMTVSKGVLEVRQNGDVVVLADTAERAEDIDVERAEEARARAEKMLADKETLSDEDFAKFTGFLEKELARIRVGSKGRV